MKNTFEAGEVESAKNKYPDDFVTRVKAEFPDWALMHEYLDANSLDVGQRIFDSSDFNMKPDDIIKAFAGGKSEDVLAAAEKSKRLKALLEEWRKLVKDWEE
jgi:hypothetical protein